MLVINQHRWLSLSCLGLRLRLRLRLSLRKAYKPVLEKRQGLQLKAKRNICFFLETNIDGCPLVVKGSLKLISVFLLSAESQQENGPLQKIKKRTTIYAGYKPAQMAVPQLFRAKPKEGLQTSWLSLTRLRSLVVSLSLAQVRARAIA